MARLYEVLFYNGWQDVPAYYLVGGIEGRSPTAALKQSLPRVIQEVRDEFSIDDDVDDSEICSSLYALKFGALVPASKVHLAS